MNRKSLKILAIIGGGVQRLPGAIDDITGTQSEVRVARAAEYIMSDENDVDMIALCGGIACGDPYQETEESVLMFAELLEVLSYSGHYLQEHKILLDHGSLTSAMNVVNLLQLIGTCQTLLHAKPMCQQESCQKTLDAFQRGDIEAIRKLTVSGLERVCEISFVTFEAHFRRLTHIVRVGLEISESELTLSFVDTGDPSPVILDGNYRSMESAQGDPLSVSPAAIERLQKRYLRSLAILRNRNECPIKRCHELHRYHVDATHMTDLRPGVWSTIPLPA